MVKIQDFKIGVSRVLVLCLIVAVLTGGLVYATLPTQPFTINRGVYPGGVWTFWAEGDTTFAKNPYGVIVYSGTDAATVLESTGALAQGGTIKIVNGIYEFNGEIVLFEFPVNLIGDGSYNTILKEVTLNYTMGSSVESVDGSNHPITISDIKLMYDEYTPSTIGIYSSKLWGLNIENCKIENYEVGIKIYAPTSGYAYGHNIRKVYFINAKYGVVLDRADSGNSPNFNTVEYSRFSVSSLLGHFQSGSSAIQTTYNSKLTINNNEFYGYETCVEFKANIDGMTFSNNYVEYQSNQYVFSSDGTTRSLQRVTVIGNLIAQDTALTKLFNDVVFTSNSFIQEIKPLLPTPNTRTAPLDPLTDAGGEWTAAFCNVPSGTGISSGINTYYFNNTLLYGGYRMPVMASFVSNDGSTNQLTIVAEDYSHTGAGSSGAIRVQITSSGAWTLTNDLVFVIRVYMFQ